MIRRTPLKRTQKFLKRTRIKRKPKPARTQSEREAKLAFEAACYGKPCAVTHTSTGIIDSHHVLSKQQIKRYVAARTLGSAENDGADPRVAYERMLTRLLWDPRNALPVARKPHDDHETGFRRIPRHLIPEQAWEFAAELGLTHVLERQYPEAA